MISGSYVWCFCGPVVLVAVLYSYVDLSVVCMMSFGIHVGRLCSVSHWLSALDVGDNQWPVYYWIGVY